MAKHSKNGDGFKHVPRSNGKDRQYVQMSFYVLNSDEYRGLSLKARIVMQAMQMQHRAHCWTSYGHKQAMAMTGLNDRSISRAWSELIKNGWLIIQGNYNHLSGKTRTWELTWMSYNGKPPKDTWKNHEK